MSRIDRMSRNIAQEYFKHKVTYDGSSFSIDHSHYVPETEFHSKEKFENYEKLVGYVGDKQLDPDVFHSTFYERVNLLLTYCDIYVPLYPFGESNYTFFYFLIKTKYQKFVAESFGQLPVFSTHIRIKDYLLSYIPVFHGGERDFFINTLSVWQRREIIDSYDLSIAYWSDRINNHPGMPPPPPPPLPPSGNIPPDKGEGETGKEYMSFM